MKSPAFSCLALILVCVGGCTVSSADPVGSEAVALSTKAPAIFVTTADGRRVLTAVDQLSGGDQGKNATVCCPPGDGACYHTPNLFVCAGQLAGACPSAGEGSGECWYDRYNGQWTCACGH